MNGHPKPTADVGAADTIAGVAPRGRWAIGSRAVFGRATASPFSLLAVLLFATATGCSSNPAKPASQFDRYPRSPALDTLIKTHAEGVNDREQWIVLTTWFRGGDPRVAMFSGVESDGRVRAWRYMQSASGPAVQPGKAGHLVADQLSALHPILESLPAAQPPPTLANLLIVSLRRGAEWTTHLYDRAAPPEALVQLFALTGAPIEPGEPVEGVPTLN